MLTVPNLRRAFSRTAVACVLIAPVGCGLPDARVARGGGPEHALGQRDARAALLGEDAPCVEVDGGNGPAPANQGVTIRFCVSTLTPVAGELVTFTVDAADPDAKLIRLDECHPNGVTFGDEGARCQGGPVCAEPPGGVAPPRKWRVRLSAQRTHTYVSAGTFTAEATLRTASECPHPYSSQASAMLTITVIEG